MNTHFRKLNHDEEDFLHILKQVAVCLKELERDIKTIKDKTAGRLVQDDVKNMHYLLEVLSKFVLKVLEKHGKD